MRPKKARPVLPRGLFLFCAGSWYGRFSVSPSPALGARCSVGRAMTRKLTTLKPRVPQMAVARVATMTPGSWRAGTMSSTARGYGYEWQKLRAEHLAKHPHCVYCLREIGMAGWSPADVVLECAARGIAEPLGTIGDHITAHRGDRRLQLDPDNIQTLCKPHHDSTKQREERSGRR